jgi:hypothetical protein
MNISGKYLKVWKVKEQNGFTKLDIGDSKKQKDGTYKSWTWFDCTLLGNAKNVQVNEKDTIEITSGIITQREYNGKWYNDIVIFEFNVTASTGGLQGYSGNDYSPKTDPKHAGNFEDDIPF